MKKTIAIYVDTDSMISFFKDDPAYGTGNKPYNADSFYSMDAPEVLFRGQHILQLEANCQYKIELKASSGKLQLTPIKYDKSFSKAPEGDLIFSMISDKTPTLEEWGQIIDLKNTKYEYTVDGLLLVKQGADGFFSVNTVQKITCFKNLKYSFLFKIAGTDKIGFIDPFISNRSEDDGKD